jgi:hypothetical protein
MTGHPQRHPPDRTGTAVLIAGVMLVVTGVISITALVVQLVLYEPPCEPVAWHFVGACGVLRLLVLLTLPVLLAGLALLAAGVVLRRRSAPLSRSPGSPGS